MLRLPETCSKELPFEFGRKCMGWEGPTAETAEIAVNTPKAPIAKKREDIIRGLSLVAAIICELSDNADDKKVAAW
jgi:hypothetical protein